MREHLKVEYRHDERIINILTYDKPINVNSEEFKAILTVIGEVLSCIISINRNRELVAHTTDEDKLYDMMLANNIINLTEKPLTVDMRVIDSVLAIPHEVMVENKTDETTHTLQLVQLILITEPKDVTLLSFILQLLKLAL